MIQSTIKWCICPVDKKIYWYPLKCNLFSFFADNYFMQFLLYQIQSFQKKNDRLTKNDAKTKKVY